MITGFLLFNLPRNLRSRPSFSARSFLLWNKWQTAAFPFLPVFHLLVNALYLPYSFPSGQSVTAISSAVISHIGHTMRSSGIIAPTTYAEIIHDALHMLCFFLHIQPHQIGKDFRVGFTDFCPQCRGIFRFPSVL